MNRLMTYFPGWTNAETVLSRLAYDIRGTPRVEYDAWTMRIIVVFDRRPYGERHTYDRIPTEYRSTFRLIERLSLRYFFDPVDDLIAFRNGVYDEMERLRGDQERLTKLIDYTTTTIRALMRGYEDRHGVFAHDYLKGVLGIEPYTAWVPKTVHQGVIDALTLERLDIPYGLDVVTTSINDCLVFVPRSVWKTA